MKNPTPLNLYKNMEGWDFLLKGIVCYLLVSIYQLVM